MVTFALIIVQTLWHFLPAAVANMAPVFASRWNLLPSLNRPLDAGRSYQSKRLLGDNKTWRGLVAGIVVAAVTGYLQYVIVASFDVSHLLLVAFGSPNEAALFGGVLGAGALGGDVLKSFLKRRLGKLSGQPWRPWDQLDAIVGALVVSHMIAPIPLPHVVTALIIFGGGTYFISMIGVWLGIKENI